MKLIKYTPETCPPSNFKQPSISINKAGVFMLSALISEKLMGSGVSLINDADRPTDWYIVKDEKGFKAQHKNKSYPNISFANRALAEKIRESIKWPDKLKTFRMRVSLTPLQVEGMELYPIITKSAKAI